MSRIDDIIDRILNEGGYSMITKMGYKSPMDAYNNDDMFLYMNMLLKDMEKKGKLKFGKWSADEEYAMGTWFWTIDEEEFIYITPYFEGEEVMSIDYNNTDGEYKTLGKEKFKATGDMKKDFDEYMKIVKKHLSKIK